MDERSEKDQRVDEDDEDVQLLKIIEDTAMYTG